MGTVVPHRQTIDLSDIDVRERPVCEQRYILSSIGGGGKFPKFFPWFDRSEDWQKQKESKTNLWMWRQRTGLRVKLNTDHALDDDDPIPYFGAH